MFTGLVTELAPIKSLIQRDEGLELMLDLSFLPELGESIAVNGICLTVSAIKSLGVEFFAARETLAKTTISNWQCGDKVNIERSLTLQQRLGGHLVSGHIDGTLQITKLNRFQDSTRFWFDFDPLGNDEYRGVLAPKGSVTLDGISLTVNDVVKHRFSVNLVPHTLSHTVAHRWQQGDWVNFEMDSIARYVASFLKQRF